MSNLEHRRLSGRDNLAIASEAPEQDLGPVEPSGPLRCVECGQVGSAHDGWRSYAVGGFDIGEPETIVYCLYCAALELR